MESSSRLDATTVGLTLCSGRRIIAISASQTDYRTFVSAPVPVNADYVPDYVLFDEAVNLDLSLSLSYRLATQQPYRSSGPWQSPTREVLHRNPVAYLCQGAQAKRQVA